MAVRYFCDGCDSDIEESACMYQQEGGSLVPCDEKKESEQKIFCASCYEWLVHYIESDDFTKTCIGLIKTGEKIVPKIEPEPNHN